jgi:hypothetical protein
MITIVKDSLKFETTSPQEAAQLAALLIDSPASPESASATISTKRKYQPRDPKELGINRVFKTLYETEPGSMKRADIATALRVKKRAVPAMIAHAHRWLNRVAPGRKFEAFIAQDGKGDDSILTLTEAGRALVRKFSATTH